MNFVTYAIPFFVLAVLAEFLYGWLRRSNTYRLADTINSLQPSHVTSSLNPTSGDVDVDSSEYLDAIAVIGKPSFRCFWKELHTRI